MPARPWSVRLACAALLVLAAPAVPSAALGAQEQPVPSRTPASLPAVPERLVVVWKPGVTRPERLAARDDANAGFVRSLGDARFQLLRPQAGQSVGDALAALRADPDVQTAVRDTYDVLHATTNDPLFGQLWGLQNTGAGIDGFSGALAGADIGALAAWDRTRGTPSTVVADLDTGYRFEHPDLAPVAWTNPHDPANGRDDDGDGIVDDTHGADFVGSSANTPTIDGDPTDDDLRDGGHGVHTAGTIGAAGDNGIGISGVAQNVRIMPLRVCSFYTDPNPANSGTLCPSSSQIEAIEYAGAHGARVANMSLGGTTFNPAVRDAIAANPNVLFVISAGNDGQDNDPGGTPHYPCAYDPATSGVPGAIDNVVCVAATDQADRLASFSDYGAATVDLGAPGTEILSTFPDVKPVDDTFETNDFASKWTATGADGGFARTNEAPLTSFGMSDSPGATPVALSVRESTSVGVTLPPGQRSCQITQTRVLSVGLGTYSYRAMLDGRQIAASSGATRSGSFFLPVSDAGVAPGGRLQLVFSYRASVLPAASDGVWLDDVGFSCMQPVGQASGYDFLQGTSMAAPQVTGAAALLFSLNPSASVAQAKAALLATVDPDAALAGKTVSGGRLDAAAALDEIRQPDTAITGRPAATSRSTRAVFTFARSDAPLAGGFQCQLDGGAFAPCASPAAYTVHRGRHTFAVRAGSPHGIVVDPSPATATWTVLQCKVPRLKGKSLAKAKRALARAHCRLGKLRKPRHARLKGLVVTASSPRAGAVRAAGAKVKLTLGKPKPKKYRRHRR
ncbi:MAG: S8 family serine peptidase [Actinobacteria bacterium]|nr:S8 family serine peptidase [Actinomycetota bacterium]